jgi:hypothetical protein
MSVGRMRTIILLAVATAGLTAAEGASTFKNVSGNKLIHTPSGVVFPNEIAGFGRRGVQYFDKTGRDVSVRYIFDDFILLDAYVYPAGGSHGSFKQESAHQKSDIRELNRNVRLVSDTGTQTTQGGKSLRGERAVYDLVRTDGLLRFRGQIRCGSQFILFQDGPWFVAYRISYPIKRSDIASRKLNEFLANWHWRNK